MQIRISGETRAWDPNYRSRCYYRSNNIDFSKNGGVRGEGAAGQSRDFIPKVYPPFSLYIYNNILLHSGREKKTIYVQYYCKR